MIQIYVSPIYPPTYLPCVREPLLSPWGEGHRFCVALGIIGLDGGGRACLTT